MKIKNRNIGVDFPPLVIAEIGINHNGCLLTAKKMVKSAFSAGCEIIKHQTHIVSDEMTLEAKTIIPPNANISIWEIMENYSLSLEDEIELKNYTESLGMIYISTPFSRSAADFLNEIDIPAFKIGSGECNNLPLIHHICQFGKPIIMSTGMQSIDVIRKSVEVIESYNIDYALLECTNLYPSPPENVSLSGITDLKNTFNNAIVGFSDHSIGPYMCLGATALGSCILERHFTDSKYRKGPDIINSMDPAELKFLIDTSKEIWTSTLNDKKRTLEEDDVYLFARGSVVADKFIPKGKILDKSDIWARRPGNGEISVDDFYKLIGKTANKDIEFNTQLSWNDFDYE